MPYIGKPPYTTMHYIPIVETEQGTKIPLLIAIGHFSYMLNGAIANIMWRLKKLMTQQAGSPFLTHENTLPSFVVKRTASTNLLVHTLLAARAGESWAQLCSADLCDATELAPLQANWSSLVRGGFALATV